MVRVVVAEEVDGDALIVAIAREIIDVQFLFMKSALNLNSDFAF